MIYYRRFHILTPNITATIILTLGKVTPITIWPVVLRPPLLPLSFVGDGDGDVDVDDNEIEEEDAGEVKLGVVERELGGYREAWLRLLYLGTTTCSKMVCSSRMSLAKAKLARTCLTVGGL